MERELVLEVRRLKDELTMARVSLANEGAETRARLAKVSVSLVISLSLLLLSCLVGCKLYYCSPNESPVATVNERRKLHD